MNVLVDTCIVVDFLQSREPFADAAREIFRAVAKERMVGFITAKSVTDVYYLMHHSLHSNSEARDLLNKLLGVIDVLDTKADDIFDALALDAADFEDAVMMATASRSKMDAIVTRNVKDYGKSSVPVYTSAQLLEIIGAYEFNHQTLAALEESEQLAKNPNVKRYSDVEKALAELKK